MAYFTILKSLQIMESCTGHNGYLCFVEAIVGSSSRAVPGWLNFPWGGQVNFCALSAGGIHFIILFELVF